MRPDQSRLVGYDYHLGAIAQPEFAQDRGAILAHRGVSYAWVAALWASTGLGMLWMDWVINREDVAFHLVLAVIMALLAGIGWGAIRLTQRRSSPAPQAQDA